jgi:hypothetical protein
VEGVLRKILARIPIADFGSEEIGEKAAYKVKAWLWNELKKQTNGEIS